VADVNAGGRATKSPPTGRAAAPPGGGAPDGPDDLAAVHRDLDRYRAENFLLTSLLDARDRQIKDVLQSTSWRITAPLRRFGGWLRNRPWLRRVAVRRRRRSFVIDDAQYQRWLREYSLVDPVVRARLTSRVYTLAARPLISIIMPSYNVDPKFLLAAIDSVRRQIYPFWELCISDDASTLSGTRELLEGCAASDERIRVTFRTTNGHISANSNSALDLAHGDYVALMDADDVLPEDALFWVAHEIGLNPDVDLIFSDEDKIDETGRRFDPYFKSAWNPALMLAQNAFCHLGVYRRSLIDRVGRFREGYEGAQDHDLVLRCAAETTPERIRHIPRVLYHWRAAPHSTAATLTAKPYAASAGQRTIEDHLRRLGIKGRVASAAGSFYQVAYELPDQPPRVSIIMPTTLRNRVTPRCLRSVLNKTRYDNFELVLVATKSDLAAHSASMKFARMLRDPRVRTLGYEASTFNFSWVNNFGAAKTRGELLCFLNDDIEVINPDWLTQLVARICLDGVAAAGPILYYPSDLIQQAGVLLGVGGVADHAFRNEERGQIGYFARAALDQDYSCLTAACLLVRRDRFEAVGGFDPTLPAAFNDIDFCIRLRRTGGRIVWTAAAQMCHYESVTFGAHNSSERADQFARDTDAMRERWRDILDNDPSYNPNLSLDPKRQFQLAAPPRTLFALSDFGDATHDRVASRTSVLP
jgi:glycosyltransferase involved in cell wall biosynthesis